VVNFSEIPIIVNMRSKMKKGFERPFTEAELVAELDPFIN